MKTAFAVFIVAMILYIATWITQPSGDEMITKLGAVIILTQIALFLAVTPGGRHGE